MPFCCFLIEPYLNKTSCASTWFVKEHIISKKEVGSRQSGRPPITLSMRALSALKIISCKTAMQITPTRNIDEIRPRLSHEEEQEENDEDVHKNVHP